MAVSFRPGYAKVVTTLDLLQTELNPPVVKALAMNAGDPGSNPG